MTNPDELERAVAKIEKYLAERAKAGQLDPIDIHALHMANIKEARPVEDAAALAPFGWAPGGYIAVCGTCGDTHGGCEKRAPRCQDCAEKLRDNPPASMTPTPSVSIDNGSRPQEAVPTCEADAAVVGRQIFLGGREPSAGVDLRYLGFVGGVSEEARAEIAALNRRAAGAVSHPSFFRPIGMQDVRLRVGEGKLSATDVLAAVNAELTDRYGRVIQAVVATTPQPADGCSSNEGAGAAPTTPVKTGEG